MAARSLPHRKPGVGRVEDMVWEGAKVFGWLSVCQGGRSPPHNGRFLHAHPRDNRGDCMIMAGHGVAQVLTVCFVQLEAQGAVWLLLIDLFCCMELSVPRSVCQVIWPW